MYERQAATAGAADQGPLNMVGGAMLQVANAQGSLDAQTRGMALELLLTIAEQAPAILRSNFKHANAGGAGGAGAAPAGDKTMLCALLSLLLSMMAEVPQDCDSDDWSPNSFGDGGDFDTGDGDEDTCSPAAYEGSHRLSAALGARILFQVS